MPDAGDFNKDQHDQDTHANWAGAFAALPQETPPADGWQRLQARLPVTTTMRRRVHWPLWLATAASLALVIAIPLRMPSAPTALPATPPPSTSPSPDPATTQPATNDRHDAVSVPKAPAPIPMERMRTAATAARIHKSRNSRRMDPSQRAIRTAAQPADTTRLATTGAAGAAEAPASRIDLESLLAQSAQLEGLLALARDDRVSTGTAAALAETLGAQVTGIDAALSQSDLSPQGRGALWRDRVDTLRELVGIETTQRLYAARGQQYEAALVSID